MAEFNIRGVKTPAKPMVFELEINNPPPPLVLLMNPESLEIRGTTKVVESRVRWTDKRDSGFVFHAHHDELDAIAVTGKSALFYTDNGLVSRQRSRTIGWENAQQLLAVYRNNGMNFNPKPNSRSSSLISSVGSVRITYDLTSYSGHFTSFSVLETQEKPFNLSFNFEFKVETRGGSSDEPQSNDILQVGSFRI